jgi:hypothetical protein
MNNVEPFTYLVDVLHRLPNTPRDQWAGLLPHRRKPATSPATLAVVSTSSPACAITRLVNRGEPPTAVVRLQLAPAAGTLPKISNATIRVCDCRDGFGGC